MFFAIAEEKLNNFCCG